MRTGTLTGSGRGEGAFDASHSSNRLMNGNCTRVSIRGLQKHPSQVPILSEPTHKTCARIQ